MNSLFLLDVFCLFCVIVVDVKTRNSELLRQVFNDITYLCREDNLTKKIRKRGLRYLNLISSISFYYGDGFYRARPSC